MKKSSFVIIILFAFIILGYVFYLIVGMSSTYPSIKEYNFAVSKFDFEKILLSKTDVSHGWEFEKMDSIYEKEDEVCYWASLLYKGNERKFEYDIKYCIDSSDLNRNNECIKLYIVGAFDHIEKSGGYKLSDKDVKKLLQTLDRTLLNGLAPHCSE